MRQDTLGRLTYFAGLLLNLLHFHVFLRNFLKVTTCCDAVTCGARVLWLHQRLCAWCAIALIIDIS